MKSQMETGRTSVRRRRSICLVLSLLYDLILATVTGRELSWLYKLVQLLPGSYILNIAQISGKRNELSIGLEQEIMGLS